MALKAKSELWDLRVPRDRKEILALLAMTERAVWMEPKASKVQPVLKVLKETLASLDTMGQRVPTEQLALKVLLVLTVRRALKVLLALPELTAMMARWDRKALQALMGLRVSKGSREWLEIRAFLATTVLKDPLDRKARKALLVWTAACRCSSTQTRPI